MTTVMGAIQRTVPISQFNRGLAGKIFEEVRKVGEKVVMKNNMAECVLMSPERYIELMDELEDAELASMARERLANFDPDKLISWEEMDRRLGITQEELDAIGEVEFE